MADLTGTTPAATYKGLLQVNDYTDGVDATAKYIQDGEGTDSALAISTDNVGIGTTSPDRKLDVQGVQGWEDSGGVERAGLNPATDGADFQLLDSNGDSSIRLDTRSSGNSYINNGNVGIGTTSPSEKLTIGGENVPKIKLISAYNSELADGVITVNEAGSVSIDADPSNNSVTYETNFRVTVDGNERMRIFSNGNVGIGTTSFGTNASGVIGIGNGTAPTSSPADMVQLYAEDVTASSELRVRDEAGNVTTLSPHAKDAPDSLYDNGKGVDEMHRVANHYLGVITFTNVDRRNDLMQKQLNGEELPEDRTFKVTETFAEYNARTGADLQVEDWDANQQAMFDAQEEKVAARQAEIDAWDNEEEEAPDPLQSYVKKPKPDWLS